MCRLGVPGGAASRRRVVSGKPPHTPASATFSLVAGSHTHYFAAESQRDAELWVALIRETWLHCFSHTARCTDGSGGALTAAAAGVAVSQKLMAENALLRDSIQSLNQQVTQANGEYWRWVLGVRWQRCVLGCVHRQLSTCTQFKQWQKQVWQTRACWGVGLAAAALRCDAAHLMHCVSWPVSSRFSVWAGLSICSGIICCPSCVCLSACAESGLRRRPGTLCWSQS